MIKQLARGWYWNGFWGFFFRPISSTRKKELIVKSGILYKKLYDEFQP